MILTPQGWLQDGILSFDAEGRLLRIDRKNSYLISSGTAICGGSAIAAVAPVIDADENQTSLSLATIFILNAVALFVFPVIGHWLGMGQTQFGTWACLLYTSDAADE